MKLIVSKFVSGYRHVAALALLAFVAVMSTPAARATAESEAFGDLQTQITTSMTSLVGYIVTAIVAAVAAAMTIYGLKLLVNIAISVFSRFSRKG